MLDLNTLRRACEAAGVEKPHSYSGRGMYGRQCPAFTGDSVPEVLAELVRLIGSLDGDGPFVEEVSELIESTHTDSMGLDVVVYWPSIKWTEDPNPDEESED